MTIELGKQKLMSVYQRVNMRKASIWFFINKYYEHFHFYPSVCFLQHTNLIYTVRPYNNKRTKLNI